VAGLRWLARVGAPRTGAAGAMGRGPRPEHRGFGGCGAGGRGAGGLFLSLDWERGCGFGVWGGGWQGEIGGGLGFFQIQ